MTLAVYQKTSEGMLRLGTFTYRGRNRSLRDAARLFHARHPKCAQWGPLFFATRHWIMGRWTDGELLPMDPPEVEVTHDGRVACAQAVDAQAGGGVMPLTPRHGDGALEDYTLTMAEVALIIDALDALRSNANGYEPTDMQLILRCRRLTAKLRKET